jgi:chemotaxis protein methyltransferase CheR
MTQEIDLSTKEFELFQKFVFKHIGIHLTDNKKFLVKNRLYKRVLEYDLESFSDYYRFIQINKHERIEMLNLITTNETYFFRELAHFNFLEKTIIPNFQTNNLRLWSAASSVGAEAYSIAMLLHDKVKSYEIFGSDINSEVIKKANIGLYPLKWMDKISPDFIQKYCLKGKGEHEGWFLVDRCLIEHINFQERNLMDSHKDIGMFDIIFLRNVLIYFDKETKINIINNVISNLKVGGYFIISLTEHIHNLNIHNLEQVQSSIFKKVK